MPRMIPPRKRDTRTPTPRAATFFRISTKAPILLKNLHEASESLRRAGMAQNPGSDPVVKVVEDIEVKRVADPRPDRSSEFARPEEEGEGHGQSHLDWKDGDHAGEDPEGHAQGQLMRFPFEPGHFQKIVSQGSAQVEGRHVSSDLEPGSHLHHEVSPLNIFLSSGRRRQAHRKGPDLWLTRSVVNRIELMQGPGQFPFPGDSAQRPPGSSSPGCSRTPP